MRKLLILTIVISLMCSSCKTTKTNCDAYGENNVYHSDVASMK